MKADKIFEYTDAPPDVAESMARAKILPGFDMTPEGIRAFGEGRKKKAITIHLRNQTIEKFKLMAKEHNGKYQTIISDLLDAYTEQYFSNPQSLPEGAEV